MVNWEGLTAKTKGATALKKEQKTQRQVPFYQYMVSLICVAFLVGGTCYIYFNHRYQKQVATVSTTHPSLAKVEALYDEIVANYVGKVNEEELVEGAMKGMAEALDDPYSTYLNQPEATELDQSLAGSFEGIGATITIKDDLPIVAQAPTEDSPAGKAGIKAEDIILQVDNEKTQGKNLTEVVSGIRGEAGTTVRLKIQRGSEIIDLNVKRAEVPIETVKGTIDAKDPSIGAITITTFGANTHEELKQTIKTLRKKGATAFVIDLRQNPGGLLTQVEQMASMFLKNGQTIVKFEDKAGQTSEVVASKELDDGFKVTEPTVVLVDKESASAAEIFAAALKESGNKKIIGTTTFGKGTVQSVKELNDDSEIKLTILKWLTPTNEWIHEKGVTPTIEADYPAYAYLSPISRETVLKEGATSVAVKNVNELLQALGYEVDPASVIYSQATVTAVKSVQSQAHLPETGEIDDATASAIEQALAEKIKENDRAYETGVKELQKEQE